MKEVIHFGIIWYLTNCALLYFYLNCPKKKWNCNISIQFAFILNGIFIYLCFSWLNVCFVNCFLLVFCVFSPFILWIWNLVILTVIHLTNTKLFRLRLPILPILKKRRRTFQNSQSIPLCKPSFKMCITKLWGKPRKHNPCNVHDIKECPSVVPVEQD